MPRDAKWPFCQKFMWLGKWESFSLSHHSFKFDIYRCCRGGDKTFSFYQILSILSFVYDQKNMQFVIWEPFIPSNHGAKFHAYKFCRSGDFNLSHGITWPYDQRDMWLGKGESWVTPLLSYVWRYCGNRHKIFNLSRDVTWPLDQKSM